MEHKIPTRTHGQVRGDTQHCWTRQDQLETRAGRTKSRRSRLAAAGSILPHRVHREEGPATAATRQRHREHGGGESIFMLLAEAEHHDA